MIGGRCYTIDGSWYQTRGIKNGRKENGLVHLECFPAFKAGRADKCLHCGHPVMEIEVAGRKFGGAFYTITAEAAAANYAGKVPPGQVHSECHYAFRKEKTPKCAVCGDPVTEMVTQDGRDFTGKFHTVAGGKRVHEECHHMANYQLRHG